METRAHHVLIGLFTLLTTAAAVVFVLWLGQMADDREFRYLDVIFQEAVTGLSKGSTVEFNGIKIGDVDGLRLDADNPHRVFARVRIDAQSPIRTDTRAHLVPAGITGLSIIRLSSGNEPESVPLVLREGVVPQIVAETSALSKFIAEGGNVMLNFNEFLLQARELFSEHNLVNIRQTLEHVETTTRQFEETQREFGPTLRAFRQTAADASTTLLEVNALLSRADQTLTSFDQLMDDDAKQALTAFRQSADAFESAMVSVESLVADSREPLRLSLEGVAQMGPLLHELRLTLTSIREITGKMENQPLDYLFDLSPPQEFKP